MGVDIRHYVVCGVYFKEDELPDVSAERLDEIWENHCLVGVEPMMNGDVVVGKILYESGNNRYEDAGIPIINVYRDSDNDQTKGDVLPLLPEEYRHAHLYDRKGKYGTWVFTQYG